jgi:hypothetical protein
LAAALYSGRFAGAGLADVAAAVPRATTDQTRKRDLLLEGLASLITDGYSAALPTIRRAYCTEDIPVADGLECLSITSVVAADVWDDDGFRDLSSRYVEIARNAGALSELLRAIKVQVIMQMLVGELDTAASAVDEARTVMEAIGSERPNYAAMVLASWQGREEQAIQLIEASMSEVVARGVGTGVSVAQWAAAVLFNGLGRYEDAVVAARRASDRAARDRDPAAAQARRPIRQHRGKRQLRQGRVPARHDLGPGLGQREREHPVRRLRRRRSCGPSQRGGGLGAAGGGAVAVVGYPMSNRSSCFPGTRPISSPLHHAAAAARTAPIRATSASHSGACRWAGDKTMPPSPWRWMYRAASR